jgi:hypothetical protein
LKTVIDAAGAHTTQRAAKNDFLFSAASDTPGNATYACQASEFGVVGDIYLIRAIYGPIFLIQQLAFF